MKTISNLIAYFILRVFVSPFYFLPYRACLALGRGIMRFVYLLDKRHRIVAFDNIKHAFPEFSDDDARSMVKKHYVHLGEMLADFLYVARIDREWMNQYIVLDPDFLAIEEAIKAAPKKLAISAHIGSWEVLLAYVGMNLNGGMMYKPVRNPFVDKWLYKIRSRSGAVLVPVEDTFRAVREIKKGVLLGLASDQNAGKSGIFVDFLNRPASTFTGPIVIGSLSKARIYMLTCYRENGKIHITGSDLGMADSADFPDKETMMKHFTRLWVSQLEKEVRKHPEQYFWVHRRWRTKPGDFPEQKYEKTG